MRAWFGDLMTVKDCSWDFQLPRVGLSPPAAAMNNEHASFAIRVWISQVVVLSAKHLNMQAHA